MKKKMNLDALKVTSFVTKMEDAKEETVKGGRPIVPIDKPFTYDFRYCTWYSELNTACGCDPISDLIICGPVEEI